jgi:RNase P/RNase MRP subunit POP5
MNGIRPVARFIAFAILSALGRSDVADAIRFFNFEAFVVSVTIHGSSFEPIVNIDATDFSRKTSNACRTLGLLLVAFARLMVLKENRRRAENGVLHADRRS